MIIILLISVILNIFYGFLIINLHSKTQKLRLLEIKKEVDNCTINILISKVNRLLLESNYYKSKLKNKDLLNNQRS